MYRNSASGNQIYREAVTEISPGASALGQLTRECALKDFLSVFKGKKVIG